MHGTCTAGYDDERGDYAVVPRDHICYRYEVVGIIGKGSFGQVVHTYAYIYIKMHIHMYYMHACPSGRLSMQSCNPVTT